MSRIGKMPVAIPAGVEVTVADGNLVTVKGPKGTLTQQLQPSMTIKQEGAELLVSRPDDGKGKVGYGLGKAAEVPEAIRKGLEAAKKNMITVTLDGTTSPHETIGEFGAGRVLMKPAAPGTGVIAGGPVRIIMEAAGIKDIRTKCLRSNTAVNVVAATFEGLKALRTPEEVARTRGKSVDEIVG